jgi:5-methylcytosine-specific restriction enzyme subunit McrC
MLKTDQWLEMTEYHPQFFDKDVLSETVATELFTRYGKQIEVEFPNPKTGGKWKLYSRGWVGYIPLQGSFGIHIKPRVSIANLFQMLEYAYHLESIKYMDGVVTCDSVQDLYERLANILALKILNRCKRGLYKTYVDEQDDLPYVRGRLNTQQIFRRLSMILLPCEYQEQTYDNEDNQILTWTLDKIIRSGICTREKTLSNIRAVLKKMKGYTSIRPFRSTDCTRRTYNRLNQDYELLHSLCRMFLDLQAPTHETGSMQAVPFLVNMARLYELFVAEWLKKHVPEGYQVRAQEKLVIGDGIRFNIDLVLYNLEQGKVQCVLDTKYKMSSIPDKNDIYQVVTYAVSKGCKEAILIYPHADIRQIDKYIRDIRVRTLSFSVDQDINLCGEAFLNQLFRGL